MKKPTGSLMEDFPDPQKIKALRTAAGLTQQQLADLLHVHRNTVARWEMDGPNGRPIPHACWLVLNWLRE